MYVRSRGVYVTNLGSAVPKRCNEIQLCVFRVTCQASRNSVSEHIAFSQLWIYSEVILAILFLLFKLRRVSPSFYGEGPHPLLWDCLRAACGKITVCGIGNRLN